MTNYGGFPYRKSKKSKVVTRQLTSMEYCANLCHKMNREKCMYWSWSLENVGAMKKPKMGFVCRWIPYEAVNLLEKTDEGKYFVMGDRYCHNNEKTSKL